MSFELFDNYRGASFDKLTIRTTNHLFVSNLVLKNFKAEKMTFASIYMDKENKKIGVLFHKDKPAAGCRRIIKENAGIIININPILRFFNVPKLSKKFVTEPIDNKGMLVFSVEGIFKR